MFQLLNLDLLLLAITVGASFILGFVVFFSSHKSVTARVFLVFCILTSLWSIANFFYYYGTSPTLGLWLIRSIVFLGVWHSFIFFRLCYVFPEAKVATNRWWPFVLLPLAVVISALTLTPLVFAHVAAVSPQGRILAIQNGKLIPLFALTVGIFILLGIGTLIRKILRSQNSVLKQQLIDVAAGMLITFVCITTFNIILPAFFNDPTFIPYSATFILPFAILTTYAIFRHHLFNVKVLATALLVFVLSIAVFTEILFTTQPILILLRVAILILLLAGGILLIKSVLREVEQRELIEKQEKELEIVNGRQENLLHFISHEVKGYFAKSAAAFAAIGDGDYGAISPELKDLSAMALADTRKGVETVMEILDAGDFKKGTLTLAHEPFDIREIVETVIAEFKPRAEEKHLAFDAHIEDSAYTVVGDKVQMQKHVIDNLIDNAINYTPQGNITVSLRREGEKIIFSVKDTGVGITPEDKTRLFTEGGRGAESVKINVHSTGYGLFIAKSIVETNGGRIWAESEGRGHGSTFFVELPTVKA
ncbi:MAG: ATP-binding protein [Minisyncoccia bacterium]